MRETDARFSFHCKHGADRAGFAEALWHIVNNIGTEQAIEKAYRLERGHLGIGEGYDKPKDFLRDNFE